MGMYGFTYILSIGSHLQSQHRLVNKFPCILPADSRTDNPSTLLVEKCFGHPRGGTCAEGPATGSPGKLSF